LYLYEPSAGGISDRIDRRAPSARRLYILLRACVRACVRAAASTVGRLPRSVLERNVSNALDFMVSHFQSAR